MKKPSPAEPSRPSADDLRPEYRFDYSKAKPNRFAHLGSAKGVTVVLDQDVAEVFTTPESVNKALRALIDVVPMTKRVKNP
jgi:hypothetical protein